MLSPHTYLEVFVGLLRKVSAVIIQQSNTCMQFGTFLLELELIYSIVGWLMLTSKNSD